MTRCSIAAFALALVAQGAACKKDGEGKGGLPPSEEWEAPADPGPAPTVEAPKAGVAAESAAGAPSDPHAGMSGDPHAGMRRNPHAGMGAGAPAGMGTGAPAGMGANADPHAGLGMKAGGGPGHGMPGGPAGHGMPGGDPSQPIDESKFLAGTIVVDAEVAERIKPSSVVFLTAHRYDPKTEGPIGSPVAVEKLAAAEFPASFRLTERSAMGGGAFAGEMVITAWTDQDRDAISKQPGDLLGRVKASIPSDGIELKLDTFLE